MRWAKRLASTSIACLLFGAGAAGWYAYYHYTDEATVRELTLKALRKSFPNAQVQIGSAEAQLFGGVSVRGVVLRTPNIAGSPDETVRIPLMQIYLDRGEMLQGRFKVRKAILEKPVVHIHRNRLGTWNVLGLTKPPVLPFNPSMIEARDGRVRITSDDPRVPAAELKDVSFDVEVAPPSTVLVRATGRHSLFEALQLSIDADAAAKRAQIELATAK
ncbi:MAG: hypothetical protein ACRC1K_22825, partial [Planctomycetia bacterium]